MFRCRFALQTTTAAQPMIPKDTLHKIAIRAHRYAKRTYSWVRGYKAALSEGFKEAWAQ